VALISGLFRSRRHQAGRKRYRTAYTSFIFENEMKILLLETTVQGSTIMETDNPFFLQT